MLRLHHYPLCPYCRKVRLVLHEKEEQPELETVEPWHQQRELAALNPAAEVPVLEDCGRVVSDSWAICEYLDETRPEPGLLGKSLIERAEIRRLVAWFDIKFSREVTDLVWREKLIKRMKGDGTPNSAAVRAGLANIHAHLEYIGFLFDRRNWLGGRGFELGRHRGCGPALGARLSGRRALGAPFRRQALVRTNQVPAELSDLAPGPRPRPQARA